MTRTKSPKLNGLAKAYKQEAAMLRDVLAAVVG